jgi:hypothetical protein
MIPIKTCAVIVAAYQAAAWIGAMLASFRAQQPAAGWRYELRLGVDGCKATSQWLQGLGVQHWFSEKNVGPYILRNSLINRTAADAYVIFDADDVMQPDFLARGLAELPPGGLGLPLKIDCDSQLQVLKEAKPSQGVCFISWEAWGRLGGYAPARCAADSDLLIRAQKLGIEIRVLAGAVFYRRCHPQSLTNGRQTGRRSQYRRQVIAQMRRRRLQGELTIKPSKVKLTHRSPQPLKVSVSIMAHEKRREWVPLLQEKLGQECPVAWERGYGRWDTGRRAWELRDPQATHHLVLQDDVILSRELLPALLKILEVVPEEPISLFARTARRWDPLIRHCQRFSNQTRWLVLKRLNWGPAILLPVSDIEPMLAWVEEHCHMPHYDVRLAYWYLHQGRPVWYTMPSLVDHRIDGDSLVWDLPSQERRRALYFIGEERSGADLDWHGLVVREPRRLQSYLLETKAFNEKHHLAGGR